MSNRQLGEKSGFQGRDSGWKHIHLRIVGIELIFKVWVRLVELHRIECRWRSGLRTKPWGIPIFSGQ